jgi:hypothetical protein
MSRGNEQSAWWEGLTADDARNTRAKLNALMRSAEPVNTGHVSQLWCVLYALGQHEEMKGLLADIKGAIPQVTVEGIETALDWLNRRQPVLRVLNGLQEKLNKWLGNYKSLAACVESLNNALQSCWSEVTRLTILKKRRKTQFRLPKGPAQ